MSGTLPTPEQIIVPFSLDSVLDEFTVPIKNRGLAVAQNLVYRRSGGFGKRTGSTVYGNPTTSSAYLAGPVISGYRWHRGVYNGASAPLARMVVQANDTLWAGNDATGAFTSIGSLTTQSTPAFYAAAFDATNSGGSANSDVLIITNGTNSPRKWDGTHFGALSSTITNPFTGCEIFNEHVFFWGDPAFPDTVYATDLGNPESTTFTTAFGGYQIGRGDGDALVRRCIKIGQTLYVFKSQGVWVIQGFDFYPGQYQFQVSGLLSGIGTTSPQSVARLRNALVWWSGQSFYRLGIGDTEAVDIGVPIPNTLAKVANGNPAVMRAVAGNFLVSSVEGFRTYNNVYLCACDVGSGLADTILMYDEQISAERGRPAWTVLKGFTVSSFIPWYGGVDRQVLYIGTTQGQVLQFGGDPYADVSFASGTNNPILRGAVPVILQTGRNDAGTPNQKKRLDRVFVDAETTTVALAVTVQSDTQSSQIEAAAALPSGMGGRWGADLWGQALWGPNVTTAYVSTEISITPEVVGNNFVVNIAETNAQSAYEIVALSYHAVQEAVPF